MRALPVLALLLLAGCASPLGARGDDTAWEAEREVFFYSAMTLAQRPEPNATAVPMRPFVQAWAEGAPHPAWLLDPLPRDALVTRMDVTLVVRATGPVVESVRFPDLMLFAGSGDAWMGYGERRDLTVLREGEVHELDVSVKLPTRGLWLPPGERLGLMVVPVMLHQEDANLEVLVGGDRPSRATLRVEPIDVARGAERRGDATGEVAGTMYAQEAAPPTTRHRTAVAVPVGATYLAAWMNTTASVGVPDLDLDLFAPDGTHVAGAGTPLPRDAVRVAGAQLPGPGEYALVVTTAGAPRAQFALEWRIGLG